MLDRGQLWRRVNDYIESIRDVVVSGEIETTDLKVTGEVQGDINMGGYSLPACQSVANLAAQGAALHFDGVDDFVNLDALAAELVDVNNAQGAIVWKGKIHSFEGGSRDLFCFGDTGSVELIDLRISNGVLTGLCYVAGVHKWGFACDSALVEDTEYVIFLTHDGTSPELYINGVSVSIIFSNETDKTVWFNETTQVDVGALGAKYFGGPPSEFLNCTVNKFGALNVCPTAAEVLALYEGGNVPFKWIGANMTPLLSGTLEIGKTYRIVDWITADDFTNVGGTNVDGNEFVATGTTPTTWTNSSILVQIGAVGQYEQDGITADTWYDKSGNGFNATIDGATPINLSKTVFADWERISVSEMGLPSANPPAKAVYGIAPALEFTVDTDHVEYKIRVPSNWVPGTDIVVHGHWTKSTADDDQSGKFAKWQLKYLSVDENENVNAGESTLTVEDEYPSAVTTTQVEAITANVTIPAAALAAHNTIYLQLMAVTPAGVALDDEPAIIAVDYKIQRYATVQ